MNKFLLPRIIKDFTNHNLKYVRKIDYSVNNKLMYNLPRYTYESTIILEKDNTNITRYFSNDCYNKLVKAMEKFLKKEIKV